MTGSTIGRLAAICLMVVGGATACGDDQNDVNENQPTLPTPAPAPDTTAVSPINPPQGPQDTVPNTTDGPGTGTKGGNPSDGDTEDGSGDGTGDQGGG
jgi:hypothetical protein